VVADVTGRASYEDSVSFLNGSHGWQWVKR
jgi:hypothetical protein